MYASLVRLTIDPHLAPAAARAFSDRILPAATGLEGFVAVQGAEGRKASHDPLLLWRTKRSINLGLV
jgi:hypothetical protein